MKAALKRLARRMWIEPSAQHFIDFNRAKFRNDPHDRRDGVVLIDMYEFQPTIFAYSIAANILARKLNASIATFIFARGVLNRFGAPYRRLEAIYESFGAKLGLSFKQEARYAEEAWRLADEAFGRLKSKWDVFEISIDGLTVGRDIYNSYLYTGKATVDIRDPQLKNFIYDAFVITRACRDYFAQKKVKAVISSHWAYNSHGILVRAAIAAGIPVYHILSTNDVYVVEVKNDTLDFLLYPEFKQMFAQLDAHKKSEYRARARKTLEERLRGKIDKGIAYMATGGKSGLTGYGAATSSPILKETGRPRVLVLLSCFLDSPLCYRSFLFADFWEWITFILDRAEQTNFDWYVKPHPSALPGNKPLLEELKRRYPKVTFLDVKASNRQLVDEGISAMFTTYGTAGHEFAYMGVPVVHGGDNPHVSYEFNITPRSVDEFERCIFEADRLKVDIDKSEVEEFFYMYYMYRFDHLASAKSSICQVMSDQGVDVDDPTTLEMFVKMEGSEEVRHIEAYFEAYFEQRHPSMKRNSRARLKGDAEL